MFHGCVLLPFGFIRSRVIQRCLGNGQRHRPLGCMGRSRLGSAAPTWNGSAPPLGSHGVHGAWSVDRWDRLRAARGDTSHGAPSWRLTPGRAPASEFFLSHSRTQEKLTGTLHDIDPRYSTTGYTRISTAMSRPGFFFYELYLSLIAFSCSFFVGATSVEVSRSARGRTVLANQC